MSQNRPFTLAPPKLAPWTLEGRRRVSTYRVFGVDELSLRDGRGGLREGLYTMACRDWVNVVALTDDDELVLVWQWRFGSTSFCLETVGGIIDEGESPAEAAARELREETGYEATAIEPLGAPFANPALHGNRLHVFLATGARKVHETHFDEHEDIEVALVGAEHTARLLDEGHVDHALCHVGLGALLRRRTSGRGL